MPQLLISTAGNLSAEMIVNEVAVVALANLNNNGGLKREHLRFVKEEEIGNVATVHLTITVKAESGHKPDKPLAQKIASDLKKLLVAKELLTPTDTVKVYFRVEDGVTAAA